MAAAGSDGSDEDFDAWFGRGLLPKIPARERMQAPQPSTTPEARSQLWRRNAIRQAYVPSLSGKTLEQVRMEADQIKLGQYFDSFREFDRCLDSYGVLHGRAAEKYATKGDHRVRVCRFGRTTRASWAPSSTQKSNQNIDKETPVLTAHQFPRNSELEPLHQQNRADTQFHPVSSSVANSLSQQDCHEFSQYDWSQDTQFLPDYLEHDTGKENRSTPVSSAIFQKGRSPLKTMSVNRNSTFLNPADLQTVMANLGSSQKTPKTIVRHTKAWLPQHNPAIHGRKISTSGACGQLNRFPIYKDPAKHLNRKDFCPFRVRAQLHSTTG
ncbi:unnamed protein product [Calypogeia fissa]